MRRQSVARFVLVVICSLLVGGAIGYVLRVPFARLGLALSTAVRGSVPVSSSELSTRSVGAERSSLGLNLSPKGSSVGTAAVNPVRSVVLKTAEGENRVSFAPRSGEQTSLQNSSGRDRHAGGVLYSPTSVASPRHPQSSGENASSQHHDVVVGSADESKLQTETQPLKVAGPSDSQIAREGPARVLQGRSNFDPAKGALLLNSPRDAPTDPRKSHDEKRESAYRGVAQSAARWAHNPEVAGAIPASAIAPDEIASLNRQPEDLRATVKSGASSKSVLIRTEVGRTDGDLPDLFVGESVRSGSPISQASVKRSDFISPEGTLALASTEAEPTGFASNQRRQVAPMEPDTPAGVNEGGSSGESIKSEPRDPSRERKSTNSKPYPFERHDKADIRLGTQTVLQQTRSANVAETPAKASSGVRLEGAFSLLALLFAICLVGNVGLYLRARKAERSSDWFYSHWGELSATRIKLRGIVQTWLDKQGHDRCWYYPDLFREIATALDLKPTVAPKLPTLEEFREGCRRYQDEQYSLKREELERASTSGPCFVCGTGEIGTKCEFHVVAATVERSSIEPELQGKPLPTYHIDVPPETRCEPGDLCSLHKPCAKHAKEDGTAAQTAICNHSIPKFPSTACEKCGQPDVWIWDTGSLFPVRGKRLSEGSS